MSLRGFHIIFISIATLLCLGLSIWVFRWSGIDPGLIRNLFGGGSAVMAVALLVYGVCFYNKIKKLDI